MLTIEPAIVLTIELTIVLTIVAWQAWLAWLASRSPLDDLWRPSSLKQGDTSHTFNQIQFWPFGVVVWPPDDL